MTIIIIIIYGMRASASYGGEAEALTNLEVVVQHLLAVQQVRARLAQVAQINLRQKADDVELVASDRLSAS